MYPIIDSINEAPTNSKFVVFQEGHSTKQVDRAWQKAEKRKEERKKSMDKKREELVESSSTDTVSLHDDDSDHGGVE